MSYDYEIGNIQNDNTCDIEDLELRSVKKSGRPLDHVAEKAVMQR